MTIEDRVTGWSTKQVAALLKTQDLTAVGEVEYIASGHWSDCFGFINGERDLVIRIGRHVEDFRKDQIAGTLRSPGLPAPQVFAIDGCGSEYFAISARKRGEPLEQSTDWPQLVVPVVDLLEALRTTDVGSLGGWGQWKSSGTPAFLSWRDYLLAVNEDSLSSRVHGWSETLTSFTLEAETFAWAYELLESSIVDDVPRSLVHNDLYHRNVHVQAGHITGVFDWGNSLVGDHLYDAAMLCFWSPWFDHTDERSVLRELHHRWTDDGGMRDFDTRFGVCLLHTGLEHIAYHAFLNNETEANLVSARIHEVMDQTWQ